MTSDVLGHKCPVLVSEKLLVKAHGKGTFVAAAKSKISNSTFLSFTENVTSMGKTLVTKTIRVTHTTPTEHQMHFLKWLRRSRLL